MLERPADARGVRPTLEMIRQNVDLQARLIDDLLDVMRIVRGKLPLHWEVADCHELIGQAVEICQSEVLGKTTAASTLDLAAGRHHVNADPARLQQVFWNLIKNAVKFTPEGGSIAVRTRNEASDDGDRLVVEVSDTGIGIEPDVLPTIFDPFQQGETTITRKFGGLGLGLAICRGIVEAHGGTLVAESPGKGRGTTFRVVLKALPEPGGRGRRRARTAARRGRRAGPALVAADPGGRGRAGDAAADGPAAAGPRATRSRRRARSPRRLEAVEAGEFDLIVSDIGLPDGSGLDLMRRLVARRGPSRRSP